jgi:uncharacterized protein YdcH (DUF465 family)
MYEARIKHLEEAHQLLDKRIDGMEKTGVFGDANLSDLKKQRLTLRDELARLRKLQWDHDHELIDIGDD